MSKEDLARWEDRHRQPSPRKPRSSVLALPRVEHGAVALDLACGQGRHAFALLDAGYRVVALDVSMQGLRHLAPVADRLLRVQADADDWPIAAASMDLVLQVDFLDRRLFPTLVRTLRYGGLLLIDTFLDQGRPNSEGPSRSDFLVAPGELPEAFPELQTLHYDEQRGDTGRVVFLGRKRGLEGRGGAPTDLFTELPPRSRTR